MAWTTPRTWVTSEVVTSSQLNTHVRDNIAYLGEAAVGTIKPTASIGTIPSTWLLCDGQSISKTTYAALWAEISLSKGTFTVTIATPGVVTLNSHGLVGGERVYLTTTGALPTGLAADTDYWVIYVDANTFRLASSVTNYLASTAINTSGTQSGTHTLVLAPYGVASSTNFKVPDLVGRVLVGYAPTGGSHIHAMGLHDDRAASVRNVNHKHTVQILTTGGANNIGATNSGQVPFQTTSTTGDTNNVDSPAFQTIRYLIKAL